MKGELHIEVDQPADLVFDFLADLRNEVTWNPRLVQLEKITDGPICAGTRFHGRYVGIGELTTELLDLDPPRHFSFRSFGPRMRIEGEFVLGSRLGATTVYLEADLMPQSFFRWLAPVMAPMIRKQNRAAGERLRHVLRARVSA